MINRYYRSHVLSAIVLSLVLCSLAESSLAQREIQVPCLCYSDAECQTQETGTGVFFPSTQRSLCVDYCLNEALNDVNWVFVSFMWGETCFDLASLPVELTRFDAVVDGDEIVLGWATASERGNAGFAIEQEVGTGEFEQIGFVEGHGTTTLPQVYSHVVTGAEPGLHRFRLKQIDFDGAFEYSPIVEAAVTVPGQFLIEPAYPNPFNPTTSLRFAVASEQHVEVSLVNAAGQSVRHLFKGTVTANESQRIVVDASGLPSGTYLVHFEGDGLTATSRIVLAK